MRTSAFALVVAVPFASLAPACEGESSFVIPVADAGAPDGRNESACTAWARVLCAYDAGCATVAAFYWTDAAQCVARTTLRCELLAADPHVAFDPTMLASCREGGAGDCADPFGKDCFGPGREANGAACVWAEDCQSGQCIVAVDLTTGYTPPCGVCQPLPCNGSCPSGQQCRSVDGGSACIPDPCDGGCSGGLQCHESNDGGASCIVLAGLGEPCSADSDCELVYYCGPSSTCSPVSHIGDACMSGPAGPPCVDPDSYCDGIGGAPGVCRSVLNVPYGGACDGVDKVCAGAGACDPTDGQCLPPASDGDVCDELQGLGCLPPARCIQHRCVFPSFAFCAGSGAP